MPLGLNVCPRCRGRGYIYYRRPARRAPCPECAGRAATPTRELEQLSAVDGVQHCFRKLERGETAPLNFELAVRRALQAGLSLEALARRAGVPMRRLRRVEGGQGALF